jgi:thioredoxin-related protein
MIMRENNDAWYSSVDRGLEGARRTDKPVFMFFCSATCFYCNRMNTDVYTQKHVSDLIHSEFVALRLTPDTPDVFRTYAVKNVPAFIIAGTDGLEYERCSGFLKAEDLEAFCLLALGKFYHDRCETKTAQQYMERLVSTYPQSLHASEGVFLRGIYRYMTSQDPLQLKESFLMLANIYPDSIWVRRSLILHFYPSVVVDWETYRRQRRDYWESPDAFVKSYATYYNGPSVHQIKCS